MGIELFNHNHKKKFNRALETLSDAATEKKDEIKDLLEEKYEHLQEVLQSAALQNKKAILQVKRMAEDAIEDGGAKVKYAMKEANKKVRKNPWPVIGGVAASALFVGYLFGAKSRK